MLLWSGGDPPGKATHRVCSMPRESASDEVVEILRNAIDQFKLLRFFYSGSERIVAPYVFGLSSEGNPLLRGIQLEGQSLSGKGAGWRVFQVLKMDDLDFYGEYFEPVYEGYDPHVPWIKEVDTQII